MGTWSKPLLRPAADSPAPGYLAPAGFPRGLQKKTPKKQGEVGRLFSRGRQKKIDGPPRTFAKSQTHPPTIRLFFLDFFFSTFFGVSRQGGFKNTQNFDKNFDVSFSSTFFVLSHFRVFFSDGSSKTLQKTFCKKNRVEKFPQKIRPKIQNRRFLDFFFITFLGVSRQGEFKNTTKNIGKKNLTLVLFRTLTHPPTTGVTDFFLLAAPWKSRDCRRRRQPRLRGKLLTRRRRGSRREGCAARGGGLQVRAGAWHCAFLYCLLLLLLGSRKKPMKHETPKFCPNNGL
jgi:hypothetical protein